MEKLTGVDFYNKAVLVTKASNVLEVINQALKALDLPQVKSLEDEVFRKIPIEHAVKITGAILVRDGSYVVINDGKNTTIEVHPAEGLKTGIVNGRNWNYGLLIKSLNHELLTSYATEPFSNKLYMLKLKDEPMQGAFILGIQLALKMPKKSLTGVFDEATHTKLIAYQKKHKLIADGQLVIGGETAKSLGLDIH